MRCKVLKNWKDFSVALPKGAENLHPHKAWTEMFRAGLFRIVMIWKQSMCVSVAEWINNLCYTQTMEHHSALKRNKLSNHEKRWGNLKHILLSKRKQSKKATFYMIWTLWHPAKGETVETEKDKNISGY